MSVDDFDLLLTWAEFATAYLGYTLRAARGQAAAWRVVVECVLKKELKRLPAATAGVVGFLRRSVGGNVGWQAPVPPVNGTPRGRHLEKEGGLRSYEFSQ